MIARGLGVLFAVWLSGAACADGIARMPGLDYQWVARDMAQNGTPLQMLAFTGLTPPEAVLAFYRERWRERGHPARTFSENGWRVLSSRLEGQVLSLRVRAAAQGSEGFLVRSETPRENARRSTAVPVPQGLRLLAQQRYDDAGRLGESLTLASPHQPSTLALQFHDAFEAAGYRRLSSGSGRTAANAYRAEYVSPQGALQLFIHRDSTRYAGQSLVLLHRMSGPSSLNPAGPRAYP